MLLTVECVPSSSSDKTQYFDALEMNVPLTSDNGKTPSSQRVPVPALAGDASAPNGEAGAQTQQDTTSPPAGREAPSPRALPAWAGSRDEDISAPFAGGIGSGRGAGTSFARKGSVRTAKSARSVTEATAAFRCGSALTGPNAEPEVDEDVIRRGAIAERSLSTKQKSKITKEERECIPPVADGFPTTESHHILQSEIRNVCPSFCRRSLNRKGMRWTGLSSPSQPCKIFTRLRASAKRKQKLHTASHCYPLRKLKVHIMKRRLVLRRNGHGGRASKGR